MAKSIQDWMREGEELYSTALSEFQNLENQIAELEQQLAAKQTEVNQIAAIIGKPPVEGNRRLTASWWTTTARIPSRIPPPPSPALAGKGLNR